MSTKKVKSVLQQKVSTASSNVSGSKRVPSQKFSITVADLAESTERATTAAKKFSQAFDPNTVLGKQPFTNRKKNRSKYLKK